MRNTETIQVLIKDALKRKQKTISWLGEAMGHDQSWASKLVGGTQKRLSPDQVERIYDLLEIDFSILQKKQTPLLEAITNDPVLAEACGALHKVLQGKFYEIGSLPSRKLHKLGKEIIRIAESGDTPTNIAKRVLAHAQTQGQ